MRYTVGIDWADNHHDICILDEQGQKTGQLRITHNQTGFDQLLDCIRKLNVPSEEIGFAIELNHGLLVSFLLDQGYAVYPIHPKSSDRYRDRHATSGKKDDVLDAFVLADALRTDRTCFKILTPDSPEARELKILVLDREHLIHDKTGLVNQLISCLKSYYPVFLGLFSEIQSKSALAFLDQYPTSEGLAGMTLKQCQQFLDAVGYPFKMLNTTVEQFYESIQSKKPFLMVDKVIVKTRMRLMEALKAQLVTVLAHIESYEKEINKLMKNYPDSDIFNSLPGAGKILSAKLAGYFGHERSRFDKFEEVQRISGTAPVTKKSGNYNHVSRRYGCQHYFRDALIQFSFSSLNCSLWARKYYDAKRKSGKTHQEALRTLANKWVKIIFTLWKKGVSYQEEIFLAAQQKHRLLNTY